MLSEAVSILAVKGDLINLQISRKASCSKCSLKNGCGQYLGSPDTESLWLNLGDISRQQDKPALVPGSRALLSLAGDAVARLALVFYMLPLLTLLVFTLAANALTASEAWLAISAVTGLMAGFAILPHALRLLTRRCRPALVSMDTTEFFPEFHDES